MQISGFDTLSYTEMAPAWEPFFEQFSSAVAEDEKKKIMQNIIEDASRMIAKALKRCEKQYRSMKE